MSDCLPKASNMEIRLVIRVNCSKNSGPEEVLPRKDNGPFAFRTVLG